MKSPRKTMPSDEAVAVILHPRDSVATALRGIARGQMVSILSEEILEVKVRENIKTGFKFAVRAIAKGRFVYKYGEIMGRAKRNIPAGAVVHTHNVQSVVKNG